MSEPGLDNVLRFNSLYGTDGSTSNGVLREPPNGQIGVSAPILGQRGDATKPSQSAESSMDPDDVLTVTDVPAVETRSDEKQLAQREGEAVARQNGGGSVVAKPDDWGNGQEPLGVAATAHNVNAHSDVPGRQTGSEELGPETVDQKQQMNDLPIAANSATFQQMNSMLIILGLAYVAGQVVSGK